MHTHLIFFWGEKTEQKKKRDKDLFSISNDVLLSQGKHLSSVSKMIDKVLLGLLRTIYTPLSLCIL